MTTPNAELAYRVLDHIDAHPERWRQDHWLTRPDGWDCGTAGCFAGWVCMLSGDTPVWEFEQDERSSEVQTPDGVDLVGNRAESLLGIDFWNGDALFSGGNTREDLGREVARIFGPRPGGKS